MTYVRGDRLDVVLDACVEDDGSTRVLFRGAFPAGSRHAPPVEEGTDRNVVQTWLDLEHTARVFHVVPHAIPVEVLRTLVDDWAAQGPASAQYADDLRAVLRLHEEKTCRA